MSLTISIITQIQQLTIAINFSSEQYEIFKNIQHLTHSHSALILIQNIKIQWNSIYNIMKRAHQLCNDICVWIDQESDQNSRSNRKLEVLWVFEWEWWQIEYIIKLLELFKKYIKTINQTQNLTIHKTFLVYSNLFDHLKNQNNIKKLNSVLKWTDELEMTVENIFIKMRKYYVYMKDKNDLLYNIATVLNSTQKLSLYKICFYWFFNEYF